MPRPMPPFRWVHEDDCPCPTECDCHHEHHRCDCEENARLAYDRAVDQRVDEAREREEGSATDGRS